MFIYPYACMFACACACVNACRGQRRALEPLDLKSQVVVSGCVRAGKRTLDFRKSSRALSHSPAPWSSFYSYFSDGYRY